MVDIRRGIRSGINSLGRSAASAGPLDAVFGYLDYEAGKAEGEDDIRAAAGATGSTIGGMVLGTLGMKLGPLGAIAGNYVGSNVGGWLGDRADELFRGNKGSAENKNNRGKNMSSFSMGMDPYYGMPQEDQYTAGDFISQGVNVAGGLGLASIAGQGALGYNDARRNLKAARSSGIDTSNIPRRQVIGEAIKARKIPRGSTAAALLLGGKLLDDALLGGSVQRGIGGVADAVTGNIFDFDGRGDGSTPEQIRERENQKRRDALNQRRQVMQNENMALLGQNAQLINPYYERLQQMNDDMLQRATDRLDYIYNRDLQDSRYTAERALQAGRENYLMETKAGQARDLLSAYTRNIPNSVANSIRGVMQARYT